MNIQFKQNVARKWAAARARLPLLDRKKHILFGLVLIMSLFLTASQSVDAPPAIAKVPHLAPPPLVALQTPVSFPTTQPSATQTPVITPAGQGATSPTATTGAPTPPSTGTAAVTTPGTPSGTEPAAGSVLTPVGQSGNWNMIFHDEFEGDTLDTSKWNTCFFNFHIAGTQDCTHDQSELELYQPGNVTANNGVLSLTAQKQDVSANGQTYHYTSGMISTGPANSSSSPKFSFQYGYMEMRAQMPAGKGFWPAFWTLAADKTYPPEIDVFEILGNAVSTVNMHYHYPNGGSEGADEGSEWNGPDFSAGWHTFAVDWEPGSLTWYVDGIARFQTTSNVTSKPQYLIANLAVGGGWPGSPNASTPFPNALQIDYIRVWQKA